MRVLHVCTGNSFRSPIAEALTRRFTGHDTESAGIAAVDHIAGRGRELLREDNADQFLKPAPDQVSDRAIHQADLIVCMTDRHYQFLEKRFAPDTETRVWRIEDPINSDVSPEEAYSRIKEKVRRL
jgi:protein-tyrosine-phosphatase